MSTRHDESLQFRRLPFWLKHEFLITLIRPLKINAKLMELRKSLYFVSRLCCQSSAENHMPLPLNWAEAMYHVENYGCDVLSTTIFFSKFLIITEVGRASLIISHSSWIQHFLVFQKDFRNTYEVTLKVDLKRFGH